MTIPQTPAWLALAGHYRRIAHVHMRELFREDPDRFARFSLEGGGIFLDYSKNRVTAETMGLLFDLARESKLPQAIERMFQGERINTTEDRAVLHTALRNCSDGPVFVDGEDVMPQVRGVLARMRTFAETIRSGRWVGYSGKPMTDIINIGIGGSHLGPMMAARALKPYSRRDLRVHFVSNVDSADIVETLESVHPETTLFIIASKTFTTQETMANAQSAREWFLSKAGDASTIARHFVAVSTNQEATRAFGIDERNVFEFWDWVGGRYSLWSAIGLPVALYVGMDAFEELLAGAFRMDEHFRLTPFEANIPVVLALLGIWYNNFFGAQSRAVVPYDQRLEYLPAYLQQLEMESNGKRITRHGTVADYATGPVVWGASGTNGQHAFFQLLHQGAPLVPVDFLAPLENQTPLGMHHDLLLANCFAQSEALMCGKTKEEARDELAAAKIPQERLERLLPYKVFPGNKPSNTILFQKLTPSALGALIALYEHKVFVEGVVWNINSFDQWGVELGKQLANQILKAFNEGAAAGEHDSSTHGLMERYRQSKRKGTPD